LKTSSSEYENSKMNAYIHITNYCVQKGHKNFSKFEEGNEVSFKDFQNFLNISKQDIKVKDIYRKMCEIVQIVFKSV